MKAKTFILVALATVTGWKGFCPNRSDVSSGGVLEGYGLNSVSQASIDQANYQWQRDKLIAAAQKSAAQAAAYAAQAAVYNNDAARRTADFAAQAASYADRAAGKVVYQRNPSELPMSLADYAAYAAQVAANAKQAAGQAAIDSAVTKLGDERDGVIAQLKAKYSPDISDLESRITALKQMAKALDGQMSQSEKENAHLRAKQLFQPKDPWRMLEGKVCNAKDASWFLFTGTILEVRPNGLLIRGDFGPPLERGFGGRDFYVDNFPLQNHPLADGETITADMNLVAHMGEKSSLYQYTNTTIDLRVNTVRRLDYGTVVSTPPPDLAQKWNNIILIEDSDPQLTKQINDNEKEQTAIEAKLQQLNSDFEKEKAPIMAEYEAKIEDVPNVFAKRAKEAESAKKQAITDKVLKNNQDLADKGDPYGLLRMGERFRDGEGVEKDVAKAKMYLQKAADAGSPTAADELKKLPNLQASQPTSTP